MPKKEFPSIVCIGGGTGQAQLLRGLKAYPCKLTAIVTVMDTGRSSGRIRNEMGTLPPGDIRNCLVALSDSEKLLMELFQYRFEKKPLKGHSFGNLFIAAFSKVAGSFEESVKATSNILAIKGAVLPSTFESTNICATLSDGTIRKGELSVRKLNKPPIQNVFLENRDVKPAKEALDAIRSADLIVIGPGGLYTSVISNILIKDLRNAVRRSNAKKVYVCNIMTQPGQTDDYSAKQHIDAVVKYLGRNTLDYVIINNKIPPAKALDMYKKGRAFLLKPPSQKILRQYNFRSITDDFIEKNAQTQKTWQKQHLLRHDPNKTAKILIKLVSPQLKAVILAAGEGSRLVPFSLSESKTMIKFLGKPLLAHHIDEFIKNGIEDIAIICNPQNCDQIRDYFGKNYKQRLTYIIQAEQKGPAHAISCAESYLKGGYFIYKYGDALAAKDELKSLLKVFRRKKGLSGIVTLKRVKDPSEYSSARFEGGTLKELIEKPKHLFPSKLSHVGLGLLDADKFFEAYKKTRVKGLLPPPEYLLRQNYRLAHWISECARIDMGRVWNILQANKLLVQKMGAKKESANISKLTHIDKRAYIGPNAIIRDGAHILGYSSVDCLVDKNSFIVDSVLMEGSWIGRNCCIVSSVIGKHNRIEDNFRVQIDKEQPKMYVRGRYVKPGMQKLGCFTGENVTIMENIVSGSGKMVFPNKVVNSDINHDLLTRAILFDADNTLYNTKTIAKSADMKAMRYFASQCGRSVTRLYKDWRIIVGRLAKSNNPQHRHRKYSYSLLAKKHNIYSKNIVKLAFESFLSQLKNDIKTMPGLKSAFPTLKNYKLAIVTEESRDLTDAKLEALGLAKNFQIILTSDDIGAMKPDERYYKKAFARLKVLPSECLVVGDSYHKDLAIPKKLGAAVVCIGESREADYSIKSYRSFLRILGRI